MFKMNQSPLLFLTKSFPRYSLLNHKPLAKLSRQLSSQVQEAFRDGQEITNTPKPPKVRVLKKFSAPFPKCFFVGKCDPEVLEYPEVLDNEETEAVKSISKQIESIVQNEANSEEIDRQAAIPKNIRQRLRDVGLYGVTLPREFGGLALTETENVFLSEAAGIDGSISKLLIEQHKLCGTFLNLFATEEQKTRYLQPLISGELTVALAYAEKFQLSDTTAGISTVALPSGSGGFELTGTKDFVYNASLADVFIVFASHPKSESDGQRSSAISAFLVPKDTPGLTVYPPAAKFGIRGMSVCKVDLDNVEIGEANIIGKPHDGLNMMLKVMGGKFSIGPSIVGLSKAVISDVTRQCIRTDYMKTPKVELENVRARLGRMMTAVYALESAVYLQAGIADTYENHDSFLETCILKVLASNTINFVLREAGQVLGSYDCLSPEFQYLDRLIRDSHYHAVADETDFLLKMTVSLHGLQHTGMVIHEEVRKIRNPVMYPVFILKKLAKNTSIFRSSTDAPTLNLGLAGYLHPTLQHAASVLESCISRCQQGAEIMLSNYGADILDKHFELESLAEIAIRTYALAATLGRASRSYCIGLKESEADMELALAFTNYCLRSVNRHFTDLSDGPVLNNTNRYMMISDRILANKGYFAESPIERNF